jgi:beta-glucosidase/6-phospho-beta-glucosidase/beta-galactosidase
MDNFEWSEGTTQRFGLAAVDFLKPDKPRTFRPSAWVYRDIVRANALTPSHLARPRSVQVSGGAAGPAP